MRVIAVRPIASGLSGNLRNLMYARHPPRFKAADSDNKNAGTQGRREG